MLFETWHLGQAFWWQLLERHCLPCDGGVVGWASGILRYDVNYLTLWSCQQ